MYREVQSLAWAKEKLRQRSLKATHQGLKTKQLESHQYFIPTHDWKLQSYSHGSRYVTIIVHPETLEHIATSDCVVAFGLEYIILKVVLRKWKCCS